MGTAALVGSAMNPPTMKMPEKEKVDIPPPMPRIRSYQPKKNMGSTAEEEMITYYNPMQAGIMTNASTNYAKGGIVSEEMNEKDVIVEAVKAIKGLSDAPEVALGIFLSEYGEEALRIWLRRYSQVHWMIPLNALLMVTRGWLRAWVMGLVKMT